MLNNEFPPLGGGTGTVNQAILQQLAKKPGLEIDLITSALGNRPEEKIFADKVRLFKVPVNNRNIHHSSNRELLTYTFRALPLALKRHRSHPYDLCLAWSAVPAGGISLILRYLAGLRYLVRVSGPDIPGFEQRYKFLYFPLKPIIKVIWKKAESIVAKCVGEADQIRSVYKGLTITLIPNGVDLEIFRPGGLIPDNGPLRLLCVGRLIERKGQHHLIEVIKRLTDSGVEIILDLVGTGDAEEGNKALARKLKVDHHVNFRGYVPREQIGRYYQGAHVFVLASYNEGMSVATLEAMASGLPVVVSRTGGTTELIEEGVNGLTFNWADLDGLTNHLRTLEKNRFLVKRMGVAARLKAEQFSWEMTASCYYKILEQMAHGSSVRSF